MLDTERHIVDIAGLDWQTKAKDRVTWSVLGEQFVAKYDVYKGNSLDWRTLTRTDDDQHGERPIAADRVRCVTLLMATDDP